MNKILILIAISIAAYLWFKDPTVTVASSDVTFSYIVKYPDGVSKSSSLPMLVAFHGNGDTAKGFYESALNEYSDPIRIVLLQGPLRYGRGKAWPWDAPGLAMYGDAVNDAVMQLAVKYPTQGKPALLGFSGGGEMAYYQAVTHGSDYSYIFPVSGRLSKDNLPKNQRDIGAKVHAFHGKKDQVVAFPLGKKAVEILQENRVRTTLTEFDGGHQGIFSSMKTKITNIVQENIAEIEN